MYTNYNLLQYAEALPDLSIDTYEKLKVYLQIKRLGKKVGSACPADGYRIQTDRYEVRIGEDVAICRDGEVVEDVPFVPDIG